ncbi:MAG: hypothetical protein EAZ63_03605 [Runella slithyformis]|nr:MAG: hypothetical protein EAZ63_03605 [Runella slithyformis]
MMLQKYVDNYNYVAGALPANIYAQAERYPSLLTNNTRLGEWCDCTDKTIYNHRKQLEALGVIKTQFRGRKNDYELWITPEILFGDGSEESASEGQKTGVLGGVRKTFLHSNINREILEKENKGKELLISGYGENSYGGRGRAEHSTDTTAPAMMRTAQSEGAAAGGGTRAERAAESQEKRALQADEFKNNTLPALPPRLEKYFADMLLGIWLHAWRVLWPNREFSKQQQEMAIAAIYAGVCNRFDDGRDAKGWADWQARNLEKLDKAAKYYDNHPDAYLPDPYAVMVKGKGYFDRENERGFAGLEAWMKRDEVRAENRRRINDEEHERRRKRAETLLRQARRDFERLKAQAPMRAEVQHHTEMQLWNYYRLIFSGLGKKYEQLFAQQYLEQQARNFVPPSYYQPKKRKKTYADAAHVVQVEEWMTWGDWHYTEV